MSVKLNSSTLSFLCTGNGSKCPKNLANFSNRLLTLNIFIDLRGENWQLLQISEIYSEMINPSLFGHFFHLQEQKDSIQNQSVEVPLSCKLLFWITNFTGRYSWTHARVKPKMSTSFGQLLLSSLKKSIVICNNYNYQKIQYFKHNSL